MSQRHQVMILVLGGVSFILAITTLFSLFGSTFWTIRDTSTGKTAIGYNRAYVVAANGDHQRLELVRSQQYGMDPDLLTISFEDAATQIEFAGISIFADSGDILILIHFAYLWVLLLVFWILAIRKMKMARVKKDSNLCSQCGYDLRASSGGCPECGATGVSNA